MATSEVIDEVERSLLTIWQQVLGRPFMGRDDDFFALGGDSLASMQLMVAVEERFDQTLPLAALAGLSSVAEMAVHVRAGMGQAPLSAAGAADAWTEILHKQKGFVAVWNGHRHQQDGLIVTLNHAGREPGLFWCFQGNQELASLSAALGPEWPVHGMRSGMLVMEYTTDAVTSLASHYAQEMLLIQPEGPFRIGGNCQGGVIARAIAILLRSLGRSVSALILMEQYQFSPYDEPVVLLFGSESDYNPYRQNADPEAVFRQAYPAGFRVGSIPGNHGEFFQPANIPRLADAVRSCLMAATEADEECATEAA